MPELAFRAKPFLRPLAGVTLPLMTFALIASLWLLARGEGSLPAGLHLVMALLAAYFLIQSALILRHHARPVVEIDDTGILFGGVAAWRRQRLAFSEIASVGALSHALLPSWVTLPVRLRSGATVRLRLGDLAASDLPAVRIAIESRVAAL